jgi:hypothetical protein
MLRSINGSLLIRLVPYLKVLQMSFMLNIVKHLYRSVEPLGGGGRDASLRGRQMSMTRFFASLNSGTSLLFINKRLRKHRACLPDGGGHFSAEHNQGIVLLGGRQGAQRLLHVVERLDVVQRRVAPRFAGYQQPQQPARAGDQYPP